MPEPAPGRTRLVVYLTPGRHRVEEIEVRADLPAAAAEVHVPIPIRPMAALRALPAPDHDGTRSLFYESGPLKGHVRGAWNPFESLFLFSWIALDPSAGMDKDFGSPEETGTPFYTSLRFWKQGASRLDRFDPLLRELGFRME